MSARRALRQSGFTYLGLLAFIVILGILLTVVSRVWSFSEQRDKEQQLLWVGDQFRNAIGAYFVNGSQYPLTLQDLLQDDRSPVAHHYLRQLYRDPLTGEADWQLIMSPTGVGIMGVASSSKLTPIKQANFSDAEVGFAKKDCYCDWKFVYAQYNDLYHRYSVPGQSQYLPAPIAPVSPNFSNQSNIPSPNSPANPTGSPPTTISTPAYPTAPAPVIPTIPTRPIGH